METVVPQAQEAVNMATADLREAFGEGDGTDAGATGREAPEAGEGSGAEATAAAPPDATAAQNGATAEDEAATND